MVREKLAVALAVIKGPRASATFDGERAVVGGDEPTNGHVVPPEPPPTFEQWGLQLPDGNIVWENSLYQGLPLQTPQQREVLIAVLRKTAADLNFEEGAFLNHYGWARRYGVPAVRWGDTVVFPLVIHDQGDSPVPPELSTGHESVVPK